MTRRAAAALALILLASACGGQQGAPVKDDPPSSPAASALEQAARDAGVVGDTSASPIGLYRSRHESGLDSLCIVPAEEPGKMRFALEAAFGEQSECHGRGSLRRSGERLVMNFDRSACLIVAGYEGDRVVIPGALDVECAGLCNKRGSLEGVSFPRVSREVGVARDARGKDGEQLCS
ncbi:hypothetical protein [Sphingobium fluviale]|uniref:Lipoprotein n=1 Tax=Sphingobium fluviale TaxID=2506423 RepID=A0A4Q1KFD0_9SPHN|nr:hypothetical protein [Sphingobium fluviale]RXR28393.1 hypothetical protein EQG66_10115 [Sphingobium fluviale]